MGDFAQTSIKRLQSLCWNRSVEFNSPGIYYTASSIQKD